MGQGAKTARGGSPSSVSNAKTIAKGGTVTPQGKLSQVARKGNPAMPLNPNATKKQ